MDLSIENLDQIHQVLVKTYNKADAVFQGFGFDESVIQSPEKRSLVNLLLDKLGFHIIEISHIKSFVQSYDCDCLPNDLVISAKQKETLLACKQLCQQIKDKAKKVLEWSVHLKDQFNREGCLISDDQLANFTTLSMHDTSISIAELHKAYEQTRMVIKEIHADLLFVDPDEMINTTGKDLEIKEGNTLFIETEHEMNIVIDYGLFQYRKNGKNIIERYFDANHQLYPPQKLAILQALKETKCSFLEIISPVYECGVMVKDHLTDQLIFMIDRELYRSISKTKNKYGLLTHYVKTPLFALTTGAAIPVQLNSSVGKKMWEIFEKMIRYSQNQQLHANTEQKQKCITDLYKIALHEDIVKAVSSKKLPTSHRS